MLRSLDCTNILFLIARNMMIMSNARKDDGGYNELTNSETVLLLCRYLSICEAQNLF